MDFCHLREVCTRYMGKVCWTLLQAKVLDGAKTAFKKVTHKTAEVIGKSKGKIGKVVPDENLERVEEIVILPQKRPEILNRLRQVL